MTILTSAEQGQSFLANVEFGRESFQAVVDTGSSDTWLVGTGFQCVDISKCTFSLLFSLLHHNLSPETYCGNRQWEFSLLSSLISHH